MLVTNGLAYGGAERVVEALAIDLSSSGAEVMVVATTRDGPIGASLRARGVAVELLGIRSALDARVPLRLGALARRFRPDVVHSHLAVADIAVALAPLGARRVTTVHNSGVELDPLKRGLWRAALSRFDRVLAVSRAVATSLPAALPIEIVHPSLVDGARGDRASARRALGVDDATPLVLGVGRLVPVKGFDVLAAARPLLRTAGARVMIIGEGPERPEGLELLGAREDAAALIAAADVVVCPSRSEGFPQVPIEAMAAGVPVVATRVGGTPEIVDDGRTGLLVPAEDPAALAAALDRVLGDRSWARALGEAGARRIVEASLLRADMSRRHRAIYEGR